MECCICLDHGLEVIICRLVCSHKICLKCVCEMNTYLCPMCRKNFKTSLPGRIIKIIDENGGKTEKPIQNSNFDVESEYHFPPLGMGEHSSP